MPFIVQCPHPDCKKYQLLEDSARGERVECLVCKRLIQVDPSGAEERPAEPSLPPALAQAALRAQRQRVAHCPQCSGPMRVPPNHEGKRIQCPHCKHVFVLSG
jgi:ribosomal protein S27E